MKLFIYKPTGNIIYLTNDKKTNMLVYKFNSGEYMCYFKSIGFEESYEIKNKFKKTSFEMLPVEYKRFLIGFCFYSPQIDNSDLFKIVKEED